MGYAKEPDYLRAGFLFIGVYLWYNILNGGALGIRMPKRKKKSCGGK